MKRFCFLTVAVLVLFTACGTWKYYPTPEEYKSYSETIDITGMDATEIYRKTNMWLRGHDENSESPFKRLKVLSSSEEEIKITLSTRWDLGAFATSDGNSVSFHIENEQCQLTMQRLKVDGSTKKGARVKAIKGMDGWKKFATEYSAYINKPALSQEELNTLMANGDAAFAGRSFSVAERSYRLILDEKKLQNVPPNADIYVALGLSILEQEQDPSETERFTLNTNTVLSSFNNWAGELRANPQLRPEWATSSPLSGYRNEDSRLEEAYQSDVGLLNRALEVFNTVLSLEPKNETALSCVNYINRSKSYVRSCYSPNRTALNNIKTSYLDPEIKRVEQQQKDAQWDAFVQNLNNLSNSIARVYQNQSGGTGGSGSGGQGQAVSPGSFGGGGSSSSSGYRDCNRCGGKGECGKCDKGTATSWNSYTSERQFYKCSICNGTGKCYDCNGKGKIRI
jgi:hypothetical protein